MSKNEMIEEIEKMLCRMYYEDVDFFYGMMSKFIRKKER